MKRRRHTVDARAAARFLAKVAKQENGCWLWTGAIQDSNLWHGSYDYGEAPTPNLRGRFYLDGKREYAHRAAWLIFRGPIPDGQVVRHVFCDNSLCVNYEDHLCLGTFAQNTADMDAKGRRRTRVA